MFTESYDVFSASGEFIKHVTSPIEVYNLIQKRPKEIFDLGDEDATVRESHTDFEMRINPSFQPQYLRSAWNKYNNYPCSW